MRIALDAMGGDKAPGEIVKGALTAVELYPELEKIILVGKEEEIKKYLKGNENKIEIKDAREVIEMDDHPALAYRKKKDASMTVATKLVKKEVLMLLYLLGIPGDR
jgi:glycerol-3-phosphate acyltransferase PlsX